MHDDNAMLIMWAWRYIIKAKVISLKTRKGVTKMNSVIKGASYILAHAPDMLVHNGTTQTTERIVNPDSEYLKDISASLRSYDSAVSYLANQTYIGNMTPAELATHEMPWYEKPMANAQRYGKFGEIMPQDEFILLMQCSDVFDLVRLDKAFVEATLPAFKAHKLIDDSIIAKVHEGVDASEIEAFLKDNHAEPLYHNGKVVGYVKAAHDVDENLSAHIIFENLASKASSVLSILHLVEICGIDKAAVDYVIDCSEEACGDMNQRGGGNFAKASAEIAGLSNATGSDLRAFCAAPTHALISAASLVASGTYDNVIVAAGGSTAKLGMNGKDHVKKGMPLLEDVIGGFAVLVSKNDGVNPIINTTYLGRHTIGTGSAPQAVISALVTNPLDKAGMKITDVDKYSVEMQNPDVTKPAGAGDVPLANYKMIAALGVKRGELEKKDLDGFTTKHGMVGWAPTQGHIPSGVPYVGFAIEDIKNGDIKNAMIIGKGSLFLARMTNQFDGVSFMMEKNTGEDGGTGVSEEQVKSLIAKAMKDFATGLMAE